eukprot:scaffold126240_cov23-Tisochrysis_lutea.AAC.1
MVWAPRYGLKGQIDATLGVVLSDANHEAAARASSAAFAPPCARSSRPTTGPSSAASARGSGTSTGTAAAGFRPAAVARSGGQTQNMSRGTVHSTATAAMGAQHSGSGSVQPSANAGAMGRVSGGLGSGWSGGRASSGSSSGSVHSRGLLAASAASTAAGLQGQQQQQQQQQYAAVDYQHHGRQAAQIVPFEFKSGRNYFLHRAQRFYSNGLQDLWTITYSVAAAEAGACKRVQCMHQLMPWMDCTVENTGAPCKVLP